MDTSAAAGGAWIEALLSLPEIAPEVVAVEQLPAVPEVPATWDPPLPAGLAEAVAAEGAVAPWSHQAAARTALRAGEHVLLTTPTASGKSLIFQLPVLEEAAAGASGRALFVVPLKALGHDQERRFRVLAAAAGLAAAAPCAVYDGDTPAVERRRLRADPPRVLITNPDMLHYGFLPHTASWQGLGPTLRWLVLDELHTYRGLFGAHVHHVLRRLLRWVQRQRPAGVPPLQLIAASATAAGAADFARALTGETFTVVADSGAARARRTLALLQPLESPYSTALRLLIRLLDAGVHVIAFTKARRITELLYGWLRRQRPDLAGRVASYRSGFLPEERRRIEADLAAGRLQGVIATSALELGIDIGSLDAAILVGYPGSVMATWQRSGRAGRRGVPGLTALVALPDALDQYLLRQPRTLLEAPLERLIVDPDNETVAAEHLECAAAELPLDREHDRALLERHAAVVGRLLANGHLRVAADTGELVAARTRPHRHVDLRNGGATVVIRRRGGAVIGTIDAVRARFECHPGAVYLHHGAAFAVEDLDLAAGEARVREVSGETYTSALAEKETHILEPLEARAGHPPAGFGRLRVTERVIGYEVRHAGSRELLSQHSLDMDPVHFETEGLWWPVSRDLARRLEDEGHTLAGSLHAAEHAAIALLPLFAICDRNDLGGISLTSHPQLPAAAVFVYDAPGGSGITRRGFAELPGWLERVRRHVRDCDCSEGCPRCVHSPRCGNGNRPLDKAGCVRLLELLLADTAGAPEPRPAPPPAVEAASAVTGAASRPRRRPVRPPRPARPEHTVLFDLETRLAAAEVGGWSQAHRMRLAIGVCLQIEEGRFTTYREEEVGELITLLESAELVVGFNILDFDYRVLSGYTGIDYRRRLPSLDLLESIHRASGLRLSLDHLARETLGTAKSADGLQSLEWVRAGRLDLVEAYCRRDVEILRDLYLHGRRHGEVVYRSRQDRRVLLPVDW